MGISVDADYWRKGLAPAAPLSLFRKFKEVANPSIVQYDPLVFSNPEPSSVTTDFWRIAREVPFMKFSLAIWSHIEFTKMLRRSLV